MIDTIKEARPIIHECYQWISPDFGFKRGDILRVAYFTVLGMRKRRRIIFVGLCLFVTQQSFCISNVYNGTPVIYTFRWPNPIIFNVSKLKSYKYSARISKVKDRHLNVFFKTQTSDKLPERIVFATDPTE